MTFRWLLLILLPTCLVAGNPRVDVSPNPVYAGEYGQIILHFDSEITKSINVQPGSGITYLRDTFQRIPPSASYEIPFLITSPGSYSIPPIRLPEGMGLDPTVAVPDITVKANGIHADDVFIESKFEVAAAYVGQRLPFTVSIWIKEALTYSRGKAESGPKLRLDLDNVEWRRQPGAQSDTRFTTTQTSEKKDGGNYRVIRSRGSCFPTQAGVLSGKARHLVPILIEDAAVNKFAGMFNAAPKRTVWVPVESQFDDVAVKNLPPRKVPEAYSLELIGDFAINLYVDKETLDEDDLLTLTLTVTGSGNLEHIKPPDLELNGWAVYKPSVSVDLKRQRAEVTWVLQPGSNQSSLPELAFTFFSLSKDQWLTKRFNKHVTFTAVSGIKPRDQLALASTSGVALYSSSNLPGVMAVIAYLLGPCMLITLLCARWLKKPGNLKQFDRRRRFILNELEGNPDADLSQTLSNELLPALRQLYGLPPGTSVDAILSRLNGDELGTLIDRLHPETYRPSPASTDRNEIISRLSQFRPLIAIVITLPFILGAAPTRAPETMYLNGDYENAIEAYRSEAAKPTADISSMINLGNCYFMDKQYVRALLCAERSLRIDPRNADAQKLYQICLPKLAKDPRSRAAILKPGEWMVISGICWCLVWLIVLTANKKRSLLKYASLGLLVAGLVTGAMVAYDEHTTTYQRNAALTLNDVELHYAPESSDGTGVVLPTADAVTIVDERPGWARVSSPRGTGWIPRNLIGRLSLSADGAMFDQL